MMSSFNTLPMPACSVSEDEGIQSIKSNRLVHGLRPHTG